MDQFSFIGGEFIKFYSFIELYLCDIVYKYYLEFYSYKLLICDIILNLEV